MANLGYIGLGVMGSRMVDRLMAKGHTVIGHNRTKSKAMVQFRGPMILNMPDEAWFNFKMMQKDVSLALELGRSVKVPLPTTSVSNDYLTAGRAMGLEKKDFAAVFQVLAKMAGVNE